LKLIVYGNYYSNIKWPIVHYGGWWDIFQQPQINTFNGSVQGADITVRNRQYLFLEPLGHCRDSENILY